MKKFSSQDACRWFRSNLSAIASDEASVEVQAQANGHRDQCSDCESEYALAVRVEQGLGVLPALFPVESPSPQLDRLFAAPGAFDAGRSIMPLAFDPTQPVELGVSCHEFKDTLGDFLSEELPVGNMLEGIEHAGTCRPCGDELSAMQTIQDGFRNLSNIEAPVSIFTSLMERIDADEAAEAATDPATVKVKKTVTARSKLLPVLG